MEKVFYRLAVLLTFVPLTATAQRFKINVSDAHFTTPIIEKWMQEYQQVDPLFDAEIVSTRGEDTDVVVEVGTQRNAGSTAVARYIILPIANKEAEIVHDNKVQKGLTDKLAHELFVEKDLDELIDEEPASRRLPGTIYTLTGSRATTTRLFAESLNVSPARLKGKKVLGREENVIAAVKSHQDAISFNVANLIYDRNNRVPASELHVFAVDIDNNGKISDEERRAVHDIDALLSLVENSPVISVPTGNVNVVLGDAKSDRLTGFVNWIVREGQRYASEYGYLKVQNRLTAQK